MRRGRPTPLDGSLLARKGDAVPAIPDDSPLVQHLDDRLAEAARLGPVSGDISAAAAAGFAGRVNMGLRWASRQIRLISSQVRWAAAIVAAVLIIAALWLSNSSNETSPIRTDRPPDAVRVVEAGDDGLHLKLTTAPDVPALQSGEIGQALAPNPPAAADAMPASAALAITRTPSVEPAVANLDAADSASAPPRASIIPMNVPSNELAPSVGDVDSAPKIPATVPKSVSPIPFPKDKPAVAAVPDTGRYAVQLASIAIEKRANEEAFRLQKQLGHILGGHEIEVEKAVVNGKGTMYRLRASGYRTQAEASRICAQIVQLKLNCLALRR